MPKPPLMGAGQKAEQQIVGFALGQAMQIDTAVNRQPSTGQLADDGFLDRMWRLPDSRFDSGPG